MAVDPTPPAVPAPSLPDLARALAAEILTPANLEKLAKNGQNVALEAAKDANELAWKAGAFLPIMLAKVVLGVMRGGEAEFDELAKVAVDGLFGEAGVQHGRSKEYTATVSAKILDAITNGAKSTEPNEDAARHFLDVATHLEIEGWLIGFISELATSVYGHLGIEHLETFGALKDGIAKSMGLSRLSRRVFGPYVDTFITTPTRQALNLKFQPHGLTEGQAVEHYLRGFITYDEMHRACALAGLNEGAIEALQYAKRRYFSAADVDLFVRSGHWTRAQGIQHLRESGLEADQAENELELQDLKALRRFQDESQTVAITAYAAGAIGAAELDQELAGAVVDPAARDRARFLAYKRRDLNPRRMTRADVERAVELKVLSITDYRDWLDQQGYATEDALTLELMLTATLHHLEDAARQRAQAAAERAATKEARRQELQSKRDALALENADFSGSIAQAEKLVIRGEIEPGRYRRVLIDHGYSEADASALMQLAIQDAATYADQQERRRQAAAKAERQQVPIGALEAAVKRGRLSLDDFRAELAARKFTAGDAQLLADVLAGEIADRAAADQARAAAAARLTARNLSLAQAEAAVRNGVQTLTDYRAFLVREGFAPADQAVLVALLSARMLEDGQAERLHAAAGAELERSKLSLAQEEAAVKEGIKTFDQYAAFLAAHGFTVDDIETLTNLLALRLGVL